MKFALDKFSGQTDVADKFCDCALVARINSVVEHRPSHRSIHGARIDVNETEPTCELARHAAFAGSSRSVDGNYPISICRFHRTSESFRAGRAEASARFTLQPARLGRGCR